MSKVFEIKDVDDFLMQKLKDSDENIELFEQYLPQAHDKTGLLYYSMSNNKPNIAKMILRDYTYTSSNEMKYSENNMLCFLVYDMKDPELLDLFLTKSNFNLNRDRCNGPNYGHFLYNAVSSYQGRKSNYEIIKVLLEHGADPKIKVHKIWIRHWLEYTSPYRLAEINKLYDIIALMDQYIKQ